MGACTEGEVPIPGTPAEGIVFPKNTDKKPIVLKISIHIAYLGVLARITAGSTYVFDGLGHDMTIGTAQGEVEHHDLIGGYESGDRHDKDQVPEEGERRPASISRLRLKTGSTLQKSTENTR